MKQKEPDHIGIRLSIMRYALCWFETMFSMLALTVLWFFTGMKIGFSEGRIKELLENADFFNLHADENYLVSLLRAVKNFTDKYFLLILLVLTALFALIIFCRWRLCRKNSLVYMKFAAASLFCGGILSVFTVILCFLTHVWTSVNFENWQNASLFAAFMKSTLFVFLALACLILVLAVISQFLAETIIKNREKSYQRRRAAERNHLEDGL